VLDSQTAPQAQRLLPAVLRATQNRSVRQQARQTPPVSLGRPGVPPPTDAPSPDETKTIRQNIQQLQQRLRQMRQPEASAGGNDEEDNTGDEEG
jgi:hypothetical protein